MEAEFEQRLMRLEMHVTHVENLCEQLNAVVTDQARELDRLRQWQKRLGTTLETLELERIRTDSKRPPHHG